MIRPAAPARWAAAGLMAVATLALAATPSVTSAERSPPARGADADPANPAAPVPALRHDSVLASRRGVAAAPAALPWRDANEQVNRIGGWRSYLRESAPAAPAAAPAPNPGPATNPAASPAATPSPAPTPASPAPRTETRP